MNRADLHEFENWLEKEPISPSGNERMGKVGVAVLIAGLAGVFGIHIVRERTREEVQSPRFSDHIDLNGLQPMPMPQKPERQYQWHEISVEDAKIDIVMNNGRPVLSFDGRQFELCEIEPEVTFYYMGCKVIAKFSPEGKILYRIAP